MRNTALYVPFDMFEQLYTNYLVGADRPTCYVAYIRAEADMVRNFGEKRHASYSSFRTILWRNRKRRRKQKQK
jgi:hypothetical protein